MRRLLIVALAGLLSACGSSSPTAPSPSPAPVPTSTHYTGTITDTVSGATVGSFSVDAPSFPAKVTVSAAGHVTRETYIRSASPTVDLFPESGFNLDFYRQFARGTLDGAVQPLRVLSQAPSIYLQRAGLSDATVSALEQAARAVVPALTGGKLAVGAWETGDTVRPEQAGWITVELIADDAANCGRSNVGGAAGHVWLNTVDRCHREGSIIAGRAVFQHEIGHALGFWHVQNPNALMYSPTIPLDAVASDLERQHGALAYHRSAGNGDVDVDSAVSAPLRAIVIE